jgi:hypothetical protein
MKSHRTKIIVYLLLTAVPQWVNYLNVWRQIPLMRYFMNTIIVTVLTLLGVIITSTLAAFAFSFKEFKGRDLSFMVLLAMMMIPQPVYLVPAYVILAKLHWLDTFYAMIVPWVVNILSIFLMRQHFKTIPPSLYEASKMDGGPAVHLAYFAARLQTGVDHHQPVLGHRQLEQFLVATDCDQQRKDAAPAGGPGLFLPGAGLALAFADVCLHHGDHAADSVLYLRPKADHRKFCFQRHQGMS